MVKAINRKTVRNDAGAIEGFELEAGNERQYFSKSDVKSLIHMGKLEVANLTLTSDGRIIESNAKSGNEFETFERECAELNAMSSIPNMKFTPYTGKRNNQNELITEPVSVSYVWGGGKADKNNAVYAITWQIMFTKTSDIYKIVICSNHTPTMVNTSNMKCMNAEGKKSIIAYVFDTLSGVKKFLNHFQFIIKHVQMNGTLPEPYTFAGIMSKNDGYGKWRIESYAHPGRVPYKVELIALTCLAYSNIGQEELFQKYAVNKLASLKEISKAGSIWDEISRVIDIEDRTKIGDKKKAAVLIAYIYCRLYNFRLSETEVELLGNNGILKRTLNDFALGIYIRAIIDIM